MRLYVAPVTVGTGARVRVAPRWSRSDMVMLIGSVDTPVIMYQHGAFSVGHHHPCTRLALAAWPIAFKRFTIKHVGAALQKRVAYPK